MKFKKRGRRISSGIAIGAKKELSCKFRVIKEMTNSDRLEVVHLDVWKKNVKIPCIAVYNPPNNVGYYDVIPCDEICLVFGDFNSPSTRWGYSTTTTAGKNTEDFVDTCPIERITSSSANDFTFMNTRGSKTNPDLIFSHVNNSHNVQQSSIALIGSHGHEVIKITMEDPTKLNVEIRCSCHGT